MMNFIRKVYYNTETGDVLTSFQASSTGNIHTTTEEDIAIYPELCPDVIERRNIGVLEWMEPDAAIEEQFANSFGVIRVDVSGDKPSIIFRLTPLPADPDEEIDERDEALRILGLVLPPSADAIQGGKLKVSLVDQALALRAAIDSACSVLKDKQA